MAETIWEGMSAGQPTRLTADGDTFSAEIMTEGLLSNIASGAWSFAKAHPFITAFAGLKAMDAIKKYNASKNNVKFAAKDASEKKSMQPVIDQMVKSGYKIVRQEYKGSSGYEWELKQ